MRIIGGGQLSKSGTPLHSGQGPAIVSNTFLVKKPNGDNQHILNIDGTTTSNGAMSITGAVSSTSTINATSTLTTDGVVKVKEQASADGDTAAYGQLWIKSETPCELYFTTDAGDDIQVTDGTAMAGGFNADAAVTFNDSGNNVDFRIEGDGDTDLFFVDASTDRVGIGTTSPGTKFDVDGDLTCDDIFTNDINMSNDHSEHAGNEIDGTKGTWTLQEGEEHMYLINRKSGKRYKLMLDEV